MATKSKGSLAAILHSAHVLSPQHLKDKEAFAKGFLDSDLVVRMPYWESPPTAKICRPLSNKWGEPQRGFLFTWDNSNEEVGGERLVEYLVAEGAKRRKKLCGNGTRRLADGTRKLRKPALRKNNEPLRIETTTLSSWDTEFLSQFATDSDIEELVHVIVQKYESVTGRKVLGANAHGDTLNWHVDIISTDIDPLLNPLESVCGKTGVWILSHGLVVDLRYEKDGFPVDPDTLQSERDQLDWHLGKKKGGKAIRNLAVGLAADDWIRGWAAKSQLSEKRLQIRQRFEDFAKKKIATIRQIKAGALALQPEGEPAPMKPAVVKSTPSIVAPSHPVGKPSKENRLVAQAQARSVMDAGLKNAERKGGPTPP